jgi:hypothetical protein
MIIETNKRDVSVSYGSKGFELSTIPRGYTAVAL